MNIAIIGYGYWGPNLVRNFKKVKDCQVTHIVDLQSQKKNELNEIYPDIQFSQNNEEVLKNTNIDAIVIATPVNTHFELAKKALEFNKHVLLEKPMTKTTEESRQLIELANKKQKILMVDHTYLYSNSVKKIKELIDNDYIGNIQYVDSTRANLGIFRSDVNVLWDLAPHDISICNYLFNEIPISVQAVGKSHSSSKLEDIAYLILHYESGKIAHFNCSWISPVKIRQMIIGGDKQMIVYNDIENQSVKVYSSTFIEKLNNDKNLKIEMTIKQGETHVPKIINEEPLLNMAKDFVNSILQGTIPLSNYESGINVVKILEASQKSIENNGIEIKL